MPTNVIMPQMGESIAEGTVTKWRKREGERVERDETLLEISTDKVDAEIPSPASGVLAKILVKENETVAVNAVLAVIDGEGVAEAVSRAEPAPAAAPRPVPAAPGVSPAPAATKARSSPLVQRIAREQNIDLTQVKGTGLDGRITKEDILAYVAESQARGAVAAMPEPHVAPPSPLAPPPPAPQIIFSGPTQVVPMTPMRRQIAERMATSKRTSAHVTTVFEVEMTKITALMAQCAEEFERQSGLKLTYTPFFVRAAVEALKDYPILNSSVEGTNIVYKQDINIGIAVALDTGLIVPVIKRADQRNFLELARAVKDLAERARTKHLRVEEVQGGTFTITNPGVFGSLFGTPIILQPQVAILGVGTIEKRPVVRNDAIAIRSMIYLALTFDHRIVDGAVADQFMGRIKVVLENWDEPVL